MTAPQALDRIIPAWTASLAGKPSPDFIISLLLKRRASLLTLMGAVLGTELLMKKRPNFRYDFAAHTALYHYTLQHTESILLRARGWDAMALLITGAPTIAIIVGGAVLAARDEFGELHIHPSRRGTLNHLYAEHAYGRGEDPCLDLNGEDEGRGTNEDQGKFGRIRNRAVEARAQGQDRGRMTTRIEGSQ